MRLVGGLVGLGGAEFRPPLLLTQFGFAALAAVIVDKAMSLVVVIAAIPARLAAVPLSEVADEWTAVVNLLAESLLGQGLAPRLFARLSVVLGCVEWVPAHRLEGIAACAHVPLGPCRPLDGRGCVSRTRCGRKSR